MHPRTVRPQKSADLIAQRIVRDIVRGGLGVGDALPTEQQMAAGYGTGRTTVREALRMLELQGVIAFRMGPRGGPVLVEPHHGHLADTIALLMQLSKDTFRSVMEVRSTIEPMVTRLAATRMDNEALAALADSVQVMERADAEDPAFWEANRAFHHVIAAAGGNVVFEFVVGSLLSIIDSDAAGVGYPNDRRLVMLKAHRHILEALVDRDPEEAARRMTEHMQDYEHFARDEFPEMLGRTVSWRPRP